MSTYWNTRLPRVVGLTLRAVLVLAASRGALAADAPVDMLLKDPTVKAALDSIRADEPTTVRNQIRLCEIPAPTFHEAARARAVKAAFEQSGLSNVRLDKAGNVLGDRPGVAPGPRLVVAAHLDTVFPEGTDVRVTRSGTVLTGPGVGDNCRGLAVLLAMARTLGRTNVKTEGPVTFVADVGEEGLGDLRGMKQLFGETMKGQIDRFLAIDGSGSFSDQRGGGQPPLPHHVQGAGRPQLRGVRHPEPGPGDGTGHRQNLAAAGSQPAESAQNDVQCRPGGWGHVGQRHPFGKLDGDRPAVRGYGRAVRTRRERAARRGRGRPRGEPAMERATHDYGREGTRGRPAIWSDPGRFTDRADGARGRASAGNPALAERELDGRQHPDSVEDSRHHNRDRRPGDGDPHDGGDVRHG